MLIHIGFIGLKYSIYILMKPTIHSVILHFLFDLVIYHWSTQAGLWDCDSLLLDSLCQRQPRGSSITGHFNPDRRCQWTTHFHWNLCSNRPRYTALLLGKRVHWIGMCGFCVLPCILGTLMVLWLYEWYGE